MISGGKLVIDKLVHTMGHGKELLFYSRHQGVISTWDSEFTVEQRACGGGHVDDKGNIYEDIDKIDDIITQISQLLPTWLGLGVTSIPSTNTLPLHLTCSASRMPLTDPVQFLGSSALHLNER